LEKRADFSLTIKAEQRTDLDKIIDRAPLREARHLSAYAERAELTHSISVQHPTF
jgi:hypothetical protein